MSNTRRYVFIVIILGFAGVVSWWSAKAESQVIHHVEKEVARLVPRFVSNPESIRNVVVNPILEPILASSLLRVISASTLENEQCVVVVTNGDDSEYGDGSATHVAVLQVNNQPIAKFRVICTSSSDPVLITGIFPESSVGVNAQ